MTIPTSNDPQQQPEVAYTKSGVPKACPSCGHPFHSAGECENTWLCNDGCGGLKDHRCMCQRNMAVRLDIPASRGPRARGMDIETVVLAELNEHYADHVSDRCDCKCYGGALDVLAEVAQLRADLASLTRQLAVAEAEIQRHEHYEDTLRSDLARVGEALAVSEQQTADAEEVPD